MKPAHSMKENPDYKQYVHKENQNKEWKHFILVLYQGQSRI